MKALAGLTAVLLGTASLTASLAIAAAPAAAGPDCGKAAQGEAAALETAKACRTRIEVSGLTTDRKQVFANPDGTMTFETYAVAKRFKSNGAWKDIDTALEKPAKPTGSAKPGNGRVRPKAVEEDLSFSAGGDRLIVATTFEGKRFELSWPGDPLPAPRIAGDTATYPEVFPGVDLVVRATQQGFSHVLVVKTAEAAKNKDVAAMRYRVGGDVRVRGNADGSLQLVDVTGKALPFGAHASSMWDSTGGQSSATEPGETAKVSSIETRAEGPDVVVKADAQLLRDGKLPIYIDPPWEVWRNNWVYASSNNSNRTPGSVARVGDDPSSTVVFRSFFNFNISGLGGTQVLTAGMNITVDHNSACAGNTGYAYRSPPQLGGDGSRVGWSPGLDVPIGSAWADSNDGTGNCTGGDHGNDDVTFGGGGFVADVQANANGWATWYTVGLCMCYNGNGSGETGLYQWMKFLWASAKFWSTYNNAPGTPTELSTSNVACGGTVGTNSPALRAKFNDVNGSDTLNSIFYYKELPSGAVQSVTGPSRPANDYGTQTLNLGTASEGKSYSWQVSTSDGIYPDRAFSAWCDFTVNSAPPPTPGVASAQYPDDGVAHGGPGEQGTFTFTNGGATGSDVVRYTYGWTNPPTNTVMVNPGASFVTTLTPPRHGFNVLYVYSNDGGSIPSPIKQYRFLVGSPDAAIAHWPLDDIAGHGLNNQIGSAHLTVEPGRTDVTWIPDRRYIGSSTAIFDWVTEASGNIPGSASANVTGLDTSKSFAVAAWVRLMELPPSNSMAVGKDGTDAGGFYLGIRYVGAPATPRWAFAVKDTSASTSTTRSIGSDWAVTSGDVGKWYHLAGVFDAAEKKVRLYVNGVLVGDVDSGTTPWNATGPVTVGRSMYNGVAADPWKGTITDVMLWNRALVAEDLWGTEANPGNGTQATPGILAPVQVGTWDFSGFDAIDGSYWGRHMTPMGNATFTSTGHDGNGSLSLNGIDAQAQTSGTVLRTDFSHTISAWIKVNSVGPTGHTIARQTNTLSSVTKLEINTGGKLAFSITNDNGDGTVSWKTATANAVVPLGTWVHVTGVFDLGTRQTRLYVNGVEQTVKGTGAWGQASTGPLQVGTDGTAWFNGEIDELKVYAGAMNAREIANLAGVQGPNVMLRDDTLTAGEFLRMDIGDYLFIMQGDGNLVLYQAGQPRWNTGTWGNPGAWLVMQADGNLVLYRSDGVPLWESATWGTAADRLYLQAGGDAVLYGPDGHVYWRLSQTQSQPAASGAVVNPSTARCMAANGTTDGAGLELRTCNGIANQRFELRSNGDIVNPATGKCVAANAITEGAGLELWGCNGMGHMKFELQSNGYIVNPATGRCVAANATTEGAGLELWGCNGMGHMKFAFLQA